MCLWTFLYRSVSAYIYASLFGLIFPTIGIAIPLLMSVLDTYRQIIFQSCFHFYSQRIPVTYCSCQCLSILQDNIPLSLAFRSLYNLIILFFPVLYKPWWLNSLWHQNKVILPELKFVRSIVLSYSYPK